jgi:hypothetical protein
MPFDIVRVDTEEVRMTCETGGEAGRLANGLNTAEQESGSPIRWRVIKRKDETPETPAWWQREYDRFATGEYKTAPWLYEPWFSGLPSATVGDQAELIRQYGAKHGHFPHVAKGDPAKIAFTPDGTWGASDRQNRMRVGRYLAQYYSDVLSNERIQELCASWDIEFGVGLEVKFAKTSDEIELVYRNGPNSCMSHGTRDYNTGDTHPSRVYGAGDLAIAYLENAGRITARSLCWPEKKIYGRTYGDTHRLHELMQALEYEHVEYCDGGDEFDGARLLKLPYKGGYIMPWLDHGGYVYDEGDSFFRITSDSGEIDAQSTEGLIMARDDSARCDSCGERYDSDNEGGYVDDRDLCESCLESETFYCEGCSDRHIGTGVYSDDLGHDYCRDCYRERHSDCHECDNEHANDNMTADVDGNLWCEDCAEDATRNEFGEIDETYEPTDNVCNEPTHETIHDHRQEELPL